MINTIAAITLNYKNTGKVSDVKKLTSLKNSGLKILQGNQACAEGAAAAGCNFFAAYPITPASEIAEHMAEILPRNRGTFVQMEDELGSISAIIGARWGGSRVMTATSGPGFSLMLEGLGYGIVTETPLVIVDVQRGGPSTGQPTSPSQQDIYQTRYGTHGDYELIVYAPASVQEMFDFTIKAFNQAEKFRVPVIVLADEIVAHMRERVRIPQKVDLFIKDPPATYQKPYSTDQFLVPPNLIFFQGHNLLIEGQLHDESGLRAGHDQKISEKLVKRLNKKIINNIEEIIDLDTYRLDQAKIIIICYGSVARSALAAVKQARERGINAGWIKLNTVWPFPEQRLRVLTNSATSIIVPEMNIGKYYREIRGCLLNKNVISQPLLGGKLHKPEEILAKIREAENNARIS